MKKVGKTFLVLFLSAALPALALAQMGGGMGRGMNGGGSRGYSMGRGMSGGGTGQWQGAGNGGYMHQGNRMGHMGDWQQMGRGDRMGQAGSGRMSQDRNGNRDSWGRGSSNHGQNKKNQRGWTQRQRGGNGNSDPNGR